MSRLIGTTTKVGAPFVAVLRIPRRSRNEGATKDSTMKAKKNRNASAGLEMHREAAARGVSQSRFGVVVKSAWIDGFPDSCSSSVTGH